MAKINERDSNDFSHSNPSVNSKGSVDPSAPTAGTEGWGMTPDEHDVVSNDHPSATRAGQMKGNPGDDRTTATLQMGGGAGPHSGKTGKEEQVPSSQGAKSTSLDASSRGITSEAAAKSFKAERSGTDRPGPSGDNQADLSRRTSGSAHSMNTSHGGTDHTFRCADAGNADCRWETSGDTEDEIMQRVEEHGKDAHGMSDWTQAMRTKVKDAIHRREAA